MMLETGKVLLVDVLEDPFESSRFHVSHWFGFLVEKFPLTTFQPHAYARLQRGESPSTYPLVKIIKSLADQDGFSGRNFLDPLEAAIDDRRRRLSERKPIYVREMWNGRDVSHLLPSSPWFHNFPPDLAGYEIIDEDGNGGYVSPYEDVGRELVTLLDDERYALTKGARKQATAELNAYICRLVGRTGPGRKPKFGNQRVLRKLAQEYQSLLALFTEVWPRPVRHTVLEVLREYDDEEPLLWSMRLALPVLAASEIRVLQRVSTSTSALAAKKRPTAKTLGIHLLAHRLNVSSADLARRIVGNSVAERLSGEENPFLSDD